MARRDKAWRSALWVSGMVMSIEKSREPWFRWFDSGDVYSYALLLKIVQVVKLTPWCSLSTCHLTFSDSRAKIAKEANIAITPTMYTSNPYNWNFLITCKSSTFKKPSLFNRDFSQGFL